MEAKEITNRPAKYHAWYKGMRPEVVDRLNELSEVGHEEEMERLIKDPSSYEASSE